MRVGGLETPVRPSRRRPGDYRWTKTASRMLRPEPTAGSSGPGVSATPEPILVVASEKMGLNAALGLMTTMDRVSFV